jgi:hypothetical protein
MNDFVLDSSWNVVLNVVANFLLILPALYVASRATRKHNTTVLDRFAEILVHLQRDGELPTKVSLKKESKSE